MEPRRFSKARKSFLKPEKKPEFRLYGYLRYRFVSKEKIASTIDKLTTSAKWTVLFCMGTMVLMLNFVKVVPLSDLSGFFNVLSYLPTPILIGVILVTTAPFVQDFSDSLHEVATKKTGYIDSKIDLRASKVRKKAARKSIFSLESFALFCWLGANVLMYIPAVTALIRIFDFLGDTLSGV